MSKPPNERPGSPNEKPGLVCRRCGCRHLFVVYTRRRATGVIRRRECRHCGYRMTTWERFMK
jgi:transcriptional regulator NrdR family protein